MSGHAATGLRATLTPRQISMMGLGSAIGAGLFVGSGEAIGRAGPAVLVSYVVAGAIVLAVMAMLAEMVAEDPAPGAFSAFAERAMGRSVGSAVGWLYWIELVVVVAAEGTGAAALMTAWVPAVPAWLWVLAFVVTMSGINLVGVRGYGTAEYWFAAVKITAIIAFLAVGAAAILGWVPGAPATGLSGLFAHGGFLPQGVTGVAGALLIVIFSFGGTEIVAIAAAESSDPAGSIRRVVRQVMVRILVFYVGSIFVIVTLLPWDGSDVREGPFAAVLAMLGVPGVDVVMSAVIVVALLSSMNANIYGASRMAYSLSERGLAPASVSRLSSRGVPVVAVGVSVVVAFASVLLNALAPDIVLPLLLNLVGSTVLVVWAAVAVSQILLRRRADRAGERSSARMPGFPVVSVLTLVLLVAVAALAMTDAQARTQLLLTLCLTAVLLIAAVWRARYAGRTGKSAGRTRGL